MGRFDPPLYRSRWRLCRVHGGVTPPQRSRSEPTVVLQVRRNHLYASGQRHWRFSRVSDKGARPANHLNRLRRVHATYLVYLRFKARMRARPYLPVRWIGQEDRCGPQTLRSGPGLFVNEAASPAPTPPAAGGPSPRRATWWVQGVEIRTCRYTLRANGGDSRFHPSDGPR